MRVEADESIYHKKIRRAAVRALSVHSTVGSAKDLAISLQYPKTSERVFCRKGVLAAVGLASSPYYSLHRINLKPRPLVSGILRRVLTKMLAALEHTLQLHHGRRGKLGDYDQPTLYMKGCFNSFKNRK